MALSVCEECVQNQVLLKRGGGRRLVRCYTCDPRVDMQIRRRRNPNLPLPPLRNEDDPLSKPMLWHRY